jgi:hypothetical protein
MLLGMRVRFRLEPKHQHWSGSCYLDERHEKILDHLLVDHTRLWNTDFICPRRSVRGCNGMCD